MALSRLYLDHAATTPLFPEARAAVAAALGRWANPSSPHAEGRAARAELEEARARIGAALGFSGTIIFTSGASEAIEIALRRAKAGPRLISAIEHDAVRRAARHADLLAVDRDGIVDLEVLGDKPLVAVQTVNNETGLVQPFERVAAVVREAGGLWLADCAQSAGKLPLPDADFLAISAHKLGGPPGVGALLVRDLAMLDATGGQEQGYRGGTENLPAILGFAAALEASRDWLHSTAALRTRLDALIAEAGGEPVGAAERRIATIASYRMPGVAATTQLIRFDMAGIAVSAGSACSSGSLRPSHVLTSMGWSADAAREVVRVSFGPETSEEDIDRFADAWRGIAKPVRAGAA